MSMRRASKSTSQHIETRVEPHKPDGAPCNDRTVNFWSVLELRASRCREHQFSLTHSLGLALIHAACNKLND